MLGFCWRIVTAVNEKLETVSAQHIFQHILNIRKHTVLLLQTGIKSSPYILKAKYSPKTRFNPCSGSQAIMYKEIGTHYYSLMMHY